MFIKRIGERREPVGPPGCSPLDDADRMPVMRVVSGDTWTVDAVLVAADGGPACPKNSHVEFVLSENQFSPPMWTGKWANGIVPDENRPGLVHVAIPREVTRALRRGSYMFSIRVSDRMRSHFDTQVSGNFLVEYLPTSDQRSIPYRDGTSEIFSPPAQCDGESHEGKGSPRRLFVLDPDTGMQYELRAVKDAEKGKIYLSVSQEGIPSNG